MIAGRKNDRQDLKRLIQPYKGAVACLHVITVLQSICQVAMAVATKFVIDSALADDGRLLLFGSLLVALLLLIVALHSWHRWLAGSTADRCVAQLRQALLQTAVESSGEEIQQYHSGARLNRGMEDVQSFCSGTISVMPAMTGQITKLVTAFCAMLLLYPRMTPWLLAASAVVIGLTALFRPVMRKRHAGVRQAEETVSSQLQEDLQQLELIQSLRAEKQIMLRFARKIKESLIAKDIRRRWSVGIESVLSLLSHAATGALLLWGATQVADKALSYGGLTAMLQLLAMLRSPVVGLSGMWGHLAAIEVAADRLQKILAPQKPEEQPLPVEQVEAVVFENVSFHYPADPAPVLENVNLRLPLDRWTCLTGISGKGKSTIFKLILGLYAPQTGRVYLDTPKGQIPCGSGTRHLFAYVPQDYSLFSGTVEENLLLVSPEADAQQLKQALSVAQADFVWELTHQLKTQVRENNSGLSKGQLQRLAIARAVLMNRPIFLLDECTSALDTETEAALLEQLSQLNRQAILVTHRTEQLQNVNDCNNISITL